MTQTNNPQAVQQGSTAPTGPQNEGEPPHIEVSVARVRANENSAITRLNDPLNESNWTTWRGKMNLMLKLCGVDPYVQGKVKCPEETIDPESADNWVFNDTYAKLLITNNVEPAQMVHVGQCSTSHEMWASLVAVHESKGHQTTISYMRNLFHTTADEGDNISDHLNKLKQYWEKLNLLGDGDFKISDLLFKIIISSSLPPSWDTYTESYVGGPTALIAGDPKRRLNSQELIGLLKEEYIRRESRKREVTHSTFSSNHFYNKPSLANRIAPPNVHPKQVPSNKFCKNCKLTNHNTHECRYLGKPKCGQCDKFGHAQKDCWFNKNSKRRREKQTGRDNDNKKSRREEANEGAKIEEVQHIAFPAFDDDPVMFSPSDEGQYFNFDQDNVYNSASNDERVLYYDWLADSATTSHICNKREAFIAYTPIENLPIAGVGQLKTHAKGRGTVQLQSLYKGRKIILELTDVLYVPDNRHNLLSLGRWDRDGRYYTGHQGQLTLFTKEGRGMMRGTKIANNLYKMQLKYMPKPQTPQFSFTASEPPKSWETWHKRFGHIGYKGLQRLLDENLVEGFTVDKQSPKPDCAACTEAKQSEKPFGISTRQTTKPGELTHIDVWGKYDVTSINGHQYFVLMIDDATRHIMVEFLKTKDQAAQKVKDYLTYLRTHEKMPCAIRTDRGREFLNEYLKTWCQSQGIELQTTAPYSPSQNGVAERMNRTLVELARAMLIAAKLPEFLWELAISHAAYLRNRAYTTAAPGATPYERWQGKKPNVSHLREFGAPVWILSQGPNVLRKMLPKSQRKAYVGYDDGSQSVKFYNAETRKILTSRNFRFLTLPDQTSPPEDIEVAPDAPREGETEGEARARTTRNDRDGQRNKRKSEELETKTNEYEPRKTRGIRTNYRYLNDPFPDEEEEGAFPNIEDNAEAMMTGDDCHSLKEAKASPEWPDWEHAIQAELDQLQQMGTWVLVDKPPDAVPIANKWVFTKKRNKEGKLTKYKARLVAKGCAQRPGHDYVETHSPVVRLETIRAIMALVPTRQLLMQQMDVKGAYLNGRLKERVYMRQPEGFDDGTGRVCLLIKTLYGLKQSGREWNIELDTKFRRYGYRRLRSDPCAYIWREGDQYGIITVWVDDLLLFATSQAILTRMGNNLRAEWEITDLGEPSKIVGIEISRTKDSITISQKRYIELILQREGLTQANAVAMPLDPNVALEPNPDGNIGDRSNSYARLLGELQFLANATRPDIAYAVNRLASYTANPSMQHTTALKRVLRYLSGTRSYGITYSSNPQNPALLGYADAAYANADDLKSTSGYVFLAGGGAITWRSKKQSTIALSSTEAEYVALSEAAREACWLRSLHGELGFPQDGPTLIRGDNDGSVALAKNPQFHKRSKHIAIRWHWVRDLVQDGVVRIENCRDRNQTADVLTKALPRPKHRQHTNEMGLVSV